jgi:RNA polymerase sigma factor (sigma-70 family)
MEKRAAYSDTELLQALQQRNGQENAIRYLFSSCFDMVRVYINGNNGNDQDAEDIFQEVVVAFIDLAVKGKFRGESSIRTFVYTMARYAWLNELKRRGRARHREIMFEKGNDTEAPDVNAYLVHRELQSRLVKLVEGLGENCRKILLAFYYDNLPMKEILRLLSYENEQVVRNKKYKCLKQLGQTVSAEPGLSNTIKTLMNYE